MPRLLPRLRRRRTQLRVAPVNTAGGITRLTSRHQEWQDAAWDAYTDNVGEFSAVVGWRASAISRTNLFVARLDNDRETTPEPVDDSNLTGILEQLGTGGDTGYSQTLKMMSIHLDVPGETILAGVPTTGDDQHWFPASPDQIVAYGSGLAIQVDNTGNPQTDYIPIPPADDTTTEARPVLRRIWEPNPRHPWLAISPARYARKPMRILNRLTDRVNANTLSRLTNSILAVDNSVTLPTGPDHANLHDDPQMAGIIYAGTTAIDDPEAPSAVFPLLAKAAVAEGEKLVDKIVKIDLGAPFDDQIVPLFDLFIRRLALMMNVPPEIMLGIGESSNYDNAWLISDDSVRIYLAPTIELICDALTRAYLRPAIAHLARNGTGTYDPNDYVVWYDTTRITQRPNRTETSLAMAAAGAISGAKLREDNGYDESAKPDAAELRARVLVDALNRGMAPADVEWYLAQLGLADGGGDVPVPVGGDAGRAAGPAGSP